MVGNLDQIMEGIKIVSQLAGGVGAITFACYFLPKHLFKKEENRPRNKHGGVSGLKLENSVVESYSGEDLRGIYR